jgi:hypothetical protein
MLRRELSRSLTNARGQEEISNEIALDRMGMLKNESKILQMRIRLLSDLFKYIIGLATL